MKKIYILVVLAAMLAACTSNEKKAQDAVKAYLEKALDDPSKYEPASWGSLDTLKVEDAPASLLNAMEVKMYKDRIADLQLLKSTMDSSSSGYADILEDERGCVTRLEEALSKVKSDSLEFCKQFRGWKITHSYRAPNKVGAIELTEQTFIIGPEFKKVSRKPNI